MSKYKSGDFVVLNNSDNDIYQINHYSHIGNGFIMKCGKSVSYCLVERHANPKEIAVGHRIFKSEEILPDRRYSIKITNLQTGKDHNLIEGFDHRKDDKPISNPKFKRGDRVYVDFISSNSMETDGTHIFGEGRIDRVDVDNNFLIGRLDKGGYFGCPFTDAKLLHEPCQHGYDIACLLCGFGISETTGERIWRTHDSM
ncbi:hypothetical protein MSG66_18095 [Acinetobacter sp. IK31]|uniref:hypothetical protein n=1 Tax=Acinetobacter sp. IK31 TaxID=2928895 RepID=UPI002D2166EF|nr:hypothetical protein [Acinetobacter sp. IK31]MEB3865916.1 hypothetical protein [Acinetobacter sp. IK31]